MFVFRGVNPLKGLTIFHGSYKPLKRPAQPVVNPTHAFGLGGKESLPSSNFKAPVFRTTFNARRLESTNGYS